MKNFNKFYTNKVLSEVAGLIADAELNPKEVILLWKEAGQLPSYPTPEEYMSQGRLPPRSMTRQMPNVNAGKPLADKFEKLYYNVLNSLKELLDITNKLDVPALDDLRVFVDRLYNALWKRANGVGGESQLALAKQAIMDYSMSRPMQQSAIA